MSLVSPVRATGNPNLVARLCSDKREVDYETTWYYLPATPNFLICTWCHENYINGTATAPSFETIRKRQGRCRFNVPRLTKSLWPTVCRTGDLSTASEYMARRLHIPDCKGGSGAVMADKVEWFVDVDREIPGFVACEACYEDIILATEFAGRFRKHPSAQGANDKWTCDLCLEYVKRAMKKFSRRKDVDGGWVEFVRTTTERMALPECNGKALCASEIKWYQPREAVEGLVFCETCFMDWLAMSPYAREFEVTIVDSESTYENWMCDLKPINMQEALYVCLEKRLSFSVFHAAASAISASPRCCADNGIVRGKWYNFKAEVSNFGVCEGCYAGILVPNGLAQFWSSKPQATGSEAELFCAFNVRVARSEEFIKRWCEMTETGAWAPYEDYIRKWAPILNCVQNEMASKRAWYGWPDCAICQECYEMFVIGTALTKSMPLQNTYLEEEKVCCMFSPRMRERYTAACAAGSADELLAFSRERWVVYQQTVPTIKTLREKSEVERETANVNMQISTTHRCMDTMDSAIGYGGYGYGYTYNGRSWAGIEADVAWNKAMAGMERANDPALWAEIRRLEGIWKTVE
ncbi:hypothetical protein B0O99DRAFT_528495 [Bisporella sp. PMI_857]|nr:hypothetical protein B0O99DRAFT_528495 [Bisporella sp. PMI_857]